MPTWMVVEDEPDLYEMILAMYSAMGINGVAFASGEEARAWLDDVDAGMLSPDIPELALIDIRLPGKLTGDQVAARLRKSTVLRNTVIILMTAYTLRGDEERKILADSGADRLIYKPLPRLTELRKLFFDMVADKKQQQKQQQQEHKEQDTT